MDWTKKECQEWLRARNLYAGGSLEEVQAMVELNSYYDEAWCIAHRWTKKECQAWLRERGLDPSGTADEVREKAIEGLIDEYNQENAPSDTESGSCILHTHPAFEWTKKQCKAWLREHGLDPSGNAEECRERVLDNWDDYSGEEYETEPEDEDEYEDEDDGSEGSDDLFGHLEHSMSNLSVGQSNRKALIVACSYQGTGSELNGTLNDADKIYALLTKAFGFHPSEIKVLRDDFRERTAQPTKSNIKYALDWLVRDATRGSSLFFYFSGHGGQEIDVTGVERSGFNQTICPSDYLTAGVIKDTYLHEALVKPLPPGAVLHALVDSCHSGTIMNLPYNAVTVEGNFQKWEKEYDAEKIHKWNSAGGLVFQFSAAASYQYANEFMRRRSAAEFEYSGAATFAFCRAIAKHKAEWGSNIMYGDLLQAMYQELRQERRFRDQTPTLSSTMELNCWNNQVSFEL